MKPPMVLENSVCQLILFAILAAILHLHEIRNKYTIMLYNQLDHLNYIL